MFYTDYYALSNYATLYYMRGGAMPVAPFTPEPVHPPGMRRDADLRRRIQEDDELLLQVIMAFLQIKDD